ncbi:rhodanese-related sulfurtransferase [Paenibacillus sp. RC62]
MNTTTKINAMTAQELTKIILNQERLFIVDIRNESDFNNWKVEGEQIEIINLPYFDLLDGVGHVLEQIPDNEPVLVICAKEGSSIFVAEQLVAAGRAQLFYLQGGMKSWRRA